MDVTGFFAFTVLTITDYEWRGCQRSHCVRLFGVRIYCHCPARRVADETFPPSQVDARNSEG
jgi:hypothetical protein